MYWQRRLLPQMLNKLFFPENFTDYISNYMFSYVSFLVACVCCVSDSLSFVSDTFLCLWRFVLYMMVCGVTLRVCCVSECFCSSIRVCCVSENVVCDWMICLWELLSLSKSVLCLSGCCIFDKFVVCLWEFVVYLWEYFCVSVQMWMSALLWLVRYADTVSVSTVWAPSSVCVWKAMSSPRTLRTVLVCR